MTSAFATVRTLALTAVTIVSACSMPGDSASGNRSTRANAPAGPSVSQASTTSANAAVSMFTVQQVQTRLKQQGVYNGNIDGVWGPATAGAVRNYQNSHGMNPTGQLDTQTIAALNLDGAGNRSDIADPPREPVKSGP